MAELDDTIKDVLRSRPALWLALLHQPPAPTQWLDTDLATVSAITDKVLLVHAATGPWILHQEFMTYHQLHLAARLRRDHALLVHQRGLPVTTVVVLLRPSANIPGLDGRLLQQSPGLSGGEFVYRVIRLWEWPVEELLTANTLGASLALLGNLTRDQLPLVIRRMREHLETTIADHGERQILWKSAQLLGGLRWDKTQLEKLMIQPDFLKASSVYREEMRREANVMRVMLRRWAISRFGAATPEQLKRLRDITDMDALEHMSDQLLRADSWEDWLGRAWPPRELSAFEQEMRAEDRRAEIAHGMRTTLAQLAAARFGPPSQEQEWELVTINDPEHLQRLTAQFLQVNSWEELLRVP
jgi:hypothetical protein